MAKLTALQKLMKNPKTAKFVETLDHADLPKGWSDDPEIVRLAKAAYKEMGDETPFYRAWRKAVGSEDNPGGESGLVYHGTRNKFDSFDTSRGRDLDYARDSVRTPIFTTPEKEFAEEYAEAFAPGTGKPKILEGWVSTKNTFDYENPKHLEMLGEALDSDDITAYFDTMKRVKEGGWKTIEGPTVQKALRDMGFDSYRTKESIAKNLAFFDPRQFKHVKNIGTFDPENPNFYKGILGALATGGAAAAGAGEAQAADDAAALARFNELADAGALPGQRRVEEMALTAPVRYAADPWRGMSLGARAVTEGVLGAPGELANAVITPFTDFRFQNPGVAVADMMGQAKPVTGAEKTMSNVVRGASDALPYIATGAGLAKLGQGAVAQGVGRSLADSPKIQAMLGGLLGLFGGE